MTPRPTPTLSEPVIVGQWWRNRRGEAIRINLSTYEGRNIVDARVWRTEEGRLKPTKKGFAAEVRHLPQLVKALAKACSQRELGLIENDAEGAE